MTILNQLRRLLPILSFGVTLLLVGCASTDSGGLRSASEPVSSATKEGQGRARARAHTELAAQYFQNQNMAVALDEIAIAIAADPTYAPVYSIRGLIQMYLKENEAADENFRKALSLAPSDPEINNNYGWYLCQTGRERESFKFFTAAVKNSLYQTPEKSLVNAGLCALRMNDLKGAEDYYQKALAMGRNRQVALLPLAQLEYQKGEYAEVVHLLADFHRLTVPSAESLWLAVRAERKLGNRSAETDFATQLRRRFPESKESRELRRGNFE